MTLGQRLLAALIALAMTFAFSAILWFVAPLRRWRPRSIAPALSAIRAFDGGPR